MCSWAHLWLQLINVNQQHVSGKSKRVLAVPYLKATHANLISPPLHFRAPELCGIGGPFSSRWRREQCLWEAPGHPSSTGLQPWDTREEWIFYQLLHLSEPGCFQQPHAQHRWVRMGRWDASKFLYCSWQSNCGSFACSHNHSDTDYLVSGRWASAYQYFHPYFHKRNRKAMLGRSERMAYFLSPSFLLSHHPSRALYQDFMFCYIFVPFLSFQFVD